MDIKVIDQLELAGKRIFMRVDFNVPMADGKITDDSRIRGALPSIRYAIEKGARLVLASHLGRPKGQVRPEFSLEPVAALLSEFLGRDVMLTDDCIGDGARKVVSDLREGQVVVLENLRFHAEEEKNDESFSKALAAHADVYINDAFGAAHRAHASTVGIAALVAERGIGFLMQRELAALGKLLAGAERPFLIVVGGAKVSDKIGVLAHLLGKVDAVLVGGAMANTFLKARGNEMGRSKVEAEKLKVALRFEEKALARGVEVLLPSDLVVATEVGPGVPTQVVASDAVPEDGMALDVGPETTARFVERLATARTIFWNGPMGLFEVPPFDQATRAVAAAVAGGSAFTVVGGGDTVAAVHQAGVADQIGHISTGGGASLELLEGRELPGVTAVRS